MIQRRGLVFETRVRAQHDNTPIKYRSTFSLYCSCVPSLWTIWPVRPYPSPVVHFTLRPCRRTTTAAARAIITRYIFITDVSFAALAYTPLRRVVHSGQHLTTPYTYAHVLAYRWYNRSALKPPLVTHLIRTVAEIMRSEILEEMPEEIMEYFCEQVLKPDWPNCIHVSIL